MLSQTAFPFLPLHSTFPLHSHTEFPTFLDYFRQLRDADPAYASKCSSHWRQFMQGPPNRPNRDECGLISAACQFFKSCDEGAY